MTHTPGIHRRDAWHVAVIAETGSTNDDLLRAAEKGALADRSVLRTDHQTTGRGRLDRRWDAPAGANLLASIYFAAPGDRPGRIVQRIGVAIVMAVRSLSASDGSAKGPGQTGQGAPHAGRAIGLKWPNDVLVDGRKLAGVLAQRSTSAPGLVVGFGVNVGWAPTDAARCADIADIADCTPAGLLEAVLEAFDALPDDDATFAELYRSNLVTVGQHVRVHLPADATFDGLAIDVDDIGRIIVRSADGIERIFDVGDVVHLRPGPAVDGVSES